MNVASAKTLDPSMEEILASIRRIIADDSDAPRTPPAPEPFAAQAASGAPVVEPEPEPAFEDEVDAGEPLEAPAAPEPVQAAVETPAPSAPAPAPSLAAAVAAVPPTPPPPRGDARPAREGLTSRETTASVAQAFGALSHTVLTHQGQTLDDLVTAMLKPMLREWLDDNLPPLVERLVRNEIERVARGGR